MNLVSYQIVICLFEKGIYLFLLCCRLAPPLYALETLAESVRRTPCQFWHVGTCAPPVGPSRGGPDSRVGRLFFHFVFYIQVPAGDFRVGWSRANLELVPESGEFTVG